MTARARKAMAWKACAPLHLCLALLLLLTPQPTSAVRFVLDVVDTMAENEETRPDEERSGQHGEAFAHRHEHSQPLPRASSKAPPFTRPYRLTSRMISSQRCERPEQLGAGVRTLC